MDAEEKNRLRMRLQRHRRNLQRQLQRASEFLVKCQIREPYVERGLLRGAVCPWELGVMEPYGFTLQEDFHDTLEAIWVWTYYTKASNQSTFLENIKSAWKYVTGNYERFIPSDQTNEGYYDCALLLHAGTLYEEAFADTTCRPWMNRAGDQLAAYLPTLRPARGREYSDPWWMTTCLARAATVLSNQKWQDVAQEFVERTILKKKQPFRVIEMEPRHRGPGGHDFFSQNATKIQALLTCPPAQEVLEDLLMNRILPVTPTQFVARRVDENPWNASVATALGKCFVVTGDLEFLRRYFAIMDELQRRDEQQSAALSRDTQILVRESWVTYFYAYAYTAVLAPAIT